MKVNWIPDEYFFFQIHFLKIYNKKQLFTGNEAISILRKLYTRKMPRALERAILNQLVVTGILEKVSKNYFRIGKTKRKDLLKINNYYIIPKTGLPF